MANDRRSVPVVRVLVVEDFEPFRRLICSMLRKMPSLQIIAKCLMGWRRYVKPKNCIRA